MTSSHAYRGGGLEATLNLAHDLYAKRGLGRVRRYHLAGDWHGGKQGQRFVALPKEDQPPDYHGCVAGRMVVFDAKQTQAAYRWELDGRYAHQYDRLRWWSEAGAVAFFAVESVPLELLFLLRIYPSSLWPVVGLASGTGHGVLVVAKTDEGWYDWLDAASGAGWTPLPGSR